MTTITDASPRILLAEEDDPTRLFLQDNLSADGFTVDPAADHVTAFGVLEQTAPDLVLIDLNGQTLNLLDDLRDRGRPELVAASDVPVIVLSDKCDHLQRVRVLERGADDIIAKPFSYPELRARIAAVLRRTAPRQTPGVINAGPIRIDRRRREVTVATRPVELSAIEYDLVCKLASEPTRVFTREELMRDVWGYTSQHTRTLDSHACRLRAKLANDTQTLIVNVWAVGYRLLDRER